MRRAPLVLASALALPGGLLAGQAPGPVTVHPDGSITGLRPAFRAATGLTAAPDRFRLDFGLPRQPPVERWLESGLLPICHTRWEHAGIRYTQSVLLTRLAEGDPTPAGQPAPDGVLMVRLAGACAASEYTEATAAFAVELQGSPVELVLREGLAFDARAGPDALVAMVDITAGGVASTNGPRLSFRGSMPPGTSGSMTIKLPLGTLPHSADLDRLRDLDFDEEARRVKRFWLEQARARATNSLPVRFPAKDVTPGD
jgi:hypothetical protein